MGRSIFFSVTPLWEIHNAQLVELVHTELDNGNQVEVVHCDSAIRSCRANPGSIPSKCELCVFQSKRNINQLLPGEIKHTWLSFKMFRLDNLEIKLENHDDLLNFLIDDLPIGRAVVSQLQTHMRESKIRKEIVKKEGVEILRNSISIFNFFQEYFNKEKIDQGFVFGGRFAAERAFLLAANQKKIPTQTFETGSSYQKVWTSSIGETQFKSYIEEVKQERQKLEEGRTFEYIGIGQKYFEEWRTGESEDPLFLNPNLDNFNSDKKLELEKLFKRYETAKKISIFTSTNYETLAFDDFAILGDKKESQFSLLRKLASIVDTFDDCLFTVRWHPNSQFSGKSDIQEMENCIRDTKVFNHIYSHEKLDSYWLIEKSDIVVTFGSTIGVEATAMGKPSILVGRASYSEIDAAQEPKDFAEFVEALRGKYEPQSINSALLWGWWRSTFGREMIHVYYKAPGFYLSNGKRILDSRIRLINQVNRWKHSCKKWLLEITKKETF